jgi:hypothetical protein
MNSSGSHYTKRRGIDEEESEPEKLATTGKEDPKKKTKRQDGLGSGERKATRTETSLSPAKEESTGMRISRMEKEGTRWIRREAPESPRKTGKVGMKKEEKEGPTGVRRTTPESRKSGRRKEEEAEEGRPTKIKATGKLRERRSRGVQQQASRPSNDKRKSISSV